MQEQGGAVGRGKGEGLQDQEKQHRIEPALSPHAALTWSMLVSSSVGLSGSLPERMYEKSTLTRRSSASAEVPPFAGGV